MSYDFSNEGAAVQWFRRITTVHRSITAAKIAGGVILLEQVVEVVIFHISLAEHPVIVIAALGALGFPVPKKD